MKIDLKNINVYILTIPQNVERLTQLTSQLENKLSFEIFYGICLTHPIGCDISLIKLWNKIKLPALVLEDDLFIRVE
jgi:GR25 family glycosyltransferase involved in LPS biosynthesis